MARVTQEDVAKAAGVTRVTVSYVINHKVDGNVQISPETRERVLKAVKELGYRVNLNARSLKTNKTQLLAILVPDLGNPFYPMQIRGAQRAAHKAGYRLMIFDSSATVEGELDFLDTVLQHIADGVLLSSFHLGAKDIQPLLENDIPCVRLGPGIEGLDAITTDQSLAVRTLIDHLVDRGHTSIAHMTGDLSTINGQIRLQAYHDSLQARLLTTRPEWVLEGNFLRESAGELVVKWYSNLSPGARPTALFVANDVMAVEAIKALQKAGVRVPEDLAVVGYDNIAEALYVDPPLTTVGQDNEAMGREAVGLLIDRIEGRRSGPPETHSFPTQLFVRESS